MTGMAGGVPRLALKPSLPEARTDPTAIANILIPTREGGRVPLSQLAEIRIVNGATIIARRENQRQISVRTNIRGRDQGSLVGEAQARFDAAIKLPPGYHVEWGGQFENLQRARKRLTIMLPITHRMAAPNTSEKVTGVAATICGVTLVWN